MAETHRKKDRKKPKTFSPKGRFRGKESNVLKKAEPHANAIMAAAKEIGERTEGKRPVLVPNTDLPKGSYISLRRDWLNAG